MRDLACHHSGHFPGPVHPGIDERGLVHWNYRCQRCNEIMDPAAVEHSYAYQSFYLPPRHVVAWEERLERDWPETQVSVSRTLLAGDPFDTILPSPWVDTLLSTLGVLAVYMHDRLVPRVLSCEEVDPDIAEWLTDPVSAAFARNCPRSLRPFMPYVRVEKDECVRRTMRTVYSVLLSPDLQAFKKLLGDLRRSWHTQGQTAAHMREGLEDALFQED